MSDTTIPKLILDPQNEEQLLEQALSRTVSASNGQISDISPGSVPYALNQGSVFAMAELLYYLNMLPEALALEVLRLCGVSRKPGTYARGSLSFLLTYPLSSNFTVPAGTVIPWENSGFILEETLNIPAGAIDGSVAVRALEVGSQYNVPAFGVTISNSAFTYAQTIYNVEPISGGSDLEPLEETIARGQRDIRSRDVLISITDYEAKAEELLGSGKAKAIPFLSGDRSQEEPGQVHVFLVNADGSVPNTDTCQYIQNELQNRSFVASKTWVSPVELFPINVEIVCQVSQLSDSLNSEILAVVKQYLSPDSFDPGSTIKVKRLEYLIQSVPGVTDLQSCLVAPVGSPGSPLPLPLPKPYSFPSLETLVLSMVDPTGLSQTVYLGPGIGDPD